MTTYTEAQNAVLSSLAALAGDEETTIEGLAYLGSTLRELGGGGVDPLDPLAVTAQNALLSSVNARAQAVDVTPEQLAYLGEVVQMISVSTLLREFKDTSNNSLTLINATVTDGVATLIDARDTALAGLDDFSAEVTAGRDAVAADRAEVLTFRDDMEVARDETFTARDAASTSATNATTSETNAETAAQDAATSETNAGLSEANAATSASSALDSKNSAAISATSAGDSASAASFSEISAGDSASAAAQSDANAASSASAAATSETNAGQSAATATNAATVAGTSETNAAQSETNAASSASSASTSATNAAQSETNAASSASSASTSATNAGESEVNAAQSKTNAASSASAAATSETNAANSASAALTSETNADESADIAVGASLSATASETAAATSETNAANSASAAATSETNATNAASAASTSETNAATSASAASTSETNAAASETNATTAQVAAEGARDLASDFANAAEDTEVQPGLFSARHWMEKAKAIANAVAADIGFAPAGAITATNTQAAVVEVDARVTAHADRTDDPHGSASQVRGGVSGTYDTLKKLYDWTAGQLQAATLLATLKTVDGAGSGLDADLLDGQSSAYYTNIPARLGYTPADAADLTGNLNAATLSGRNLDDASTPSTVAGRNSSGDVVARLFRTEYAPSGSGSYPNFVMLGNGSDNYMRPITVAGARSALDVPTNGYMESRAQAWANDRVASMAIRRVSQGLMRSPYTGVTEGGQSSPGGCSVTGILWRGSSYLSGLYYHYLQMFDPVRGWVSMQG